MSPTTVYQDFYLLLEFQVDETLSPFRLSQEQLLLVKSRIRAGLEAGLSHQHSEIRMLPSYVYNAPDCTGEKISLSERYIDTRR